MEDTSFVNRAMGKLERSRLLLSKQLVQRLGAVSRTNTKHVAFVAGVQRSGTNMMMDVLERSYETDVYHERDARAFENFQWRSPEVVQELWRHSTAPCFVIKTLCELQDLSRLMQKFAPARTIWIFRDYQDVVNSMLVSFKNHAKQILRIAKNRTSDGWRSKGMSDETYALIQEHAHPDLNDASAAALMWYLRNILFFEQGLDHDPRVIVVHYEDIVTEPDTYFHRIFDFLELKYTKRVNSKVFASSIRRRASPDIDMPVRKICDGLLGRYMSVLQDTNK